MSRERGAPRNGDRSADAIGLPTARLRIRNRAAEAIA